MKPEEKILISQINGRNREVFKMLFDEHYTQLVRFAEGMLFDIDEAKDVVQNLFIHLWEKAEDINLNTSIKGYLFQSTRNRCINKIKSLQVTDKRNLLYMEGLLNSETLEATVDDVETDRALRALDLLPDKMQEIVRLKYIEQLKQREIADQLGITENTIKTQLQRAKKKLRDMLY